MKIFVNLARLEIGQLFTQGTMQGHPCNWTHFYLFLKNTGNKIDFFFTFLQINCSAGFLHKGYPFL